MFGDNPDRMHYSRDVTQQGQQNIQPERAAKPHLQKYAERRQQNSNQNTNYIHAASPYIERLRFLTSEKQGVRQASRTE